MMIVDKNMNVLQVNRSFTKMMSLPDNSDKANKLINLKCYDFTKNIFLPQFQLFMPKCFFRTSLFRKGCYA